MRMAAVKFGEMPNVPLTRPGILSDEDRRAARDLQTCMQRQADHVRGETERRLERADCDDRQRAEPARTRGLAEDRHRRRDRGQERDPPGTADRQSDDVARRLGDEDRADQTSDDEDGDADDGDGRPRHRRPADVTDPAPWYERQEDHQPEQRQRVVERKAKDDRVVRDDGCRHDKQESAGRCEARSATRLARDLVADGCDDRCQTKKYEYHVDGHDSRSSRYRMRSDR